MCESTFDLTKFKLVECENCGAEGSTACCMASQINGSEQLCPNCQEE
jgi:hypothetical protein